MHETVGAALPAAARSETAGDSRLGVGTCDHGPWSVKIHDRCARGDLNPHTLSGTGT
ncbi:MAG: hypothetical protein QOJ71_1172 [Actinomycetota bacterium]|nr:hypothetical protein [Actinomycetota bacterium]